MALILALIVLTFTPMTNNEASADGYGWTPTVRYEDATSNQKVKLSDGDTLTGDMFDGSLFFYVEFSDESIKANNNYYYYVSSVVVSDVTTISNSAWKTIDKEDGADFYQEEENFDSSDRNIYVYFRRTYTLDGVAQYEYYPNKTFIRINVTLGEEDIGINGVVAQYLRGNNYEVYNGSWISSALRFTLTTTYMEKNSTAYDVNKELLYYSITKEEDKWIPMSSNVVEIKGVPLTNAPIKFRVCDIGKQHFATYVYGTGEHEGEYNVNLDPYTPNFSVSATTSDLQGSAIEYLNGSWSSKSVKFVLNKDNNCNSEITYYCSLNGNDFLEMASREYMVTVTTSSIIFRAQSKAGLLYTYGITYNVNIDVKTPNVALGAGTPNPDNENTEKELDITEKDGLFTAGYANGKINLYVYNRDAGGEPIDNKSGAIFYYQARSEKGLYSNTWTRMTSIKSGEETCYTISDTINKDMSLTRYYKFKIVSGAGLESTEKEITFTIIKSTFIIDIEEIKSSVNASGWIADKAVVYMIMPTDSVYENGSYTMPTVEYDFYYVASDGTDKEYNSHGKAVKFYEETDGVNYWLYEFDLIASANSTFNIYARNLAGKKSINTIVTDEKIAIDVLEPEYNMTAHILPNDVNFDEDDYIYLDIINPGWVNGAVVITIKVKVGVSGVYLKDMIYATDSNGNILTDTATGEMVWQEKTTARTVDEIIIENEMEYYCYYVTVNVDDNQTKIMSRDSKFRIYTGSGIFKEISFTVNIDTTDTIRLSEVTFDSGENYAEVAVTDANGVIDMDDKGYSVCEDIKISFASSIDSPDFEDHYNVYYKIFDGEGVSDLLAHASGIYNYDLLKGEEINIPIEANKKGHVYVAVYVQNSAQAYDGSCKQSGYYVLRFSYDTVNLVIGYDIASFSPNGEEVTDEMESGKWVAGYLEITLSIYINAEGDTKADDSYTFYYMLIAGSTSNIQEVISQGTWLKPDNGEYTGDGKYKFNIGFVEQSFYGILAFSVTNGAGYRNTQDASSTKIIRIDNTTPDIDEIIKYQQANENYLVGLRKEEGKVDVTGLTEGITLYTYYSTKEMYLQGVSDVNRSNIQYYYTYLGTQVDSKVFALTDLTTLSGTVNVFSDVVGVTIEENGYYVAYFAIYAVNAVGAEASNGSCDSSNQVTFSAVYCFVCDTNTLSGSLTPDKNKGHYNEQIKMYSYEWVEDVSLTVIANGKTTTTNENYVTYEFSVDNGKNWFRYLDGGVEYWYDASASVKLMFNAELLAEYVDANGNHPFNNGVISAFLFRGVNKAGAIITYESIYIAIDETIPDFEIIAVDDKGISYTGGSTESLTSGDEVWKSGPITVTIDVTTMPVSGIKATYYLAYIENGNTVYTKNDGETGKALNNLTFTTDMLDGFNKNRDAILYVTVTSIAGDAFMREKAIRLSVDQVVPEFTLLGHASNSESDITQTIVSGQWTNRSTVSISKAEKEEGQNVSEVVYTYTYKDSNSTGVINYTWANEEGNITRSNSCEIMVTATTEAGLTCTVPFIVNIDTTPPIIKFDGNINVIEGQEYYIDLKVYVEEANIEICEYITIKGDTRGFAFDPTGYILSTSSVDNSIRYDTLGNEYRGYVKIYVKDYAGNVDTFELYVLPFKLTVNNVTLSDEDLAQVDEYGVMLSKARVYMESSRVAYFENLISRLNDRITTLNKEIKGYQDYLEKLANRSSFELRSDYAEMLDYMNTFNDYELYGQKWIQDAITGDSTSKYYAYYQNFLTQFGKLQALMDKVNNVEKHVIALPAINMVEREDYEDILRIYDEYKDLTMDQKACFTANLYNKLTDLKESCEVLLLTDAESGIAINGDFAPGAMISVTDYDSTTDTFTNAQSLLAKTVSESDPRTIVSVCRIALDGAYSQTVSSDMVVTLPIPQEYRDYINFSVYTLSDNGAMKKVEGTEIQPDGESIVFSTDELTTYVLCIKAEMEETDTTENSYGTLMGIELDVKMIKYLIYGGIALFGVVIIIVIILGIRHRRFLNSYNKAYRHSLYRKGVKGIPKGNKKI